MTLRWIGEPCQSGLPRRLALARLGVLAGVLIASLALWQVSIGTAEEPGLAASALRGAERGSSDAQSPPDAPLPPAEDAPLPPSVAAEPNQGSEIKDRGSEVADRGSASVPSPTPPDAGPPAPADVPTGFDEIPTTAKTREDQAKEAAPETPRILSAEVAEVEQNSPPPAPEPNAAVEHEGARIVASVDSQPAPAASQTEPVTAPDASPKTEPVVQSDPLRDAITNVLRIVSGMEDASGSAPDSQPAGPPQALAADRKQPGAAAARKVPTSFETRPIGELTVNISCRKGDLPTDFGREQLAQMQAKGRSIVFERNWPRMGYCWDAPGLCYNPLYFEEVNLERYGYGPRYVRVAQPLISAGQFFVTVPILPYRLVAEPSRQCVYTLGHYRPGSAVPYQIQLPPLDLKAGTVEAGVIVGLIYLIP